MGSGAVRQVGVALLFAAIAIIPGTQFDRFEYFSLDAQGWSGPGPADDATWRWSAALTPAGPSRLEAGQAPWGAHIRRMDAALLARDLKTAEWAWYEAYLTALGSRTWEGMLAVGQAYLRIGAAARGHAMAMAKARQVYLVALFRARAAGSVDGALLVALAFAELGDREVVEQCLRVAEGLASRDRNAAALGRVHDVRTRLPSRRTPKTFEPDPDVFLSAEERAGP